MLNDEEHGCGSIGRSVALLCAGLGVGAAVLMLLALGISKFFILPFPFPKEILVGLVVLFIAAASLGKKAGIYLCDKTRSTGRNVLVGIGVVDTGSIERLVVEVFSVWTFRVVVALDNVRPFATNVDCGGGKV